MRGDLCWDFTTCADLDPTEAISVNEHTSVGEIIWQANVTEVDGTDANVQYTLTGYEKPTSNWTCLEISTGRFSFTSCLYTRKFNAPSKH